MLFKKIFRLKPISPHLTIYFVQTSSLISIVHRISGIINFTFFLLFSYFFYITLNFFFYFNLLVSKPFLFFFFSFFLFFFFSSIIFHVLNGLKMLFLKFLFFYNF